MADNTLRHRRLDQVPAQSRKRLKHDVSKLVAAPSTALSVPRPFGDLSEACVEDIADCAAVAWETVTHSSGRKTRRIATRRVLTYLAQFPGKTWQDRWVASGLDEPGNALRERFEYGPHKTQVALGLRCLLCLRVIRPSLRAIRSNDFVGLAEQFRHVQNDQRLDEFFAAESASSHSLGQQRTSLFDLTFVLITQGIALDDLTPEGLLCYSLECHKYGLTRGASAGSSRFAGHATWETLHGMGAFPPGTPQHLRAVLVAGQKSVTELVDSYPIRSSGVRKLLIDYLERRRTELDYSALTGLAQILVSAFWQKIEQIAPEQADLNISSDVYQKWREDVSFVGKERDQPRRALESLLLQVRGFYLDLQSWALEEPERWGIWAVPCPVPRHEVRSARIGRRRAKERTDNRIRERQPLLPTLVDHAETKHRKSRALLEAAASITPGEEFTYAGRSYRRTNSRADQAKARHTRAPVRVQDLATGEVVHAEGAEEDAFWDWAYVETLRLSGVRIEELVELTQLSVRQYQRPNGEVVALLVIAPSKTDRERVIPMSAELFHVIASVIRRHTTGGQRSIPLIQRYDAHERQWSASMPFLFQRGSRGGRGVISTHTVAGRLRMLCRELAESNTSFVGLTFAPHDFRRLFATEIVNNGLPIHIGAALLGHLNIETTGGYVGVFNEDVVRHYQEFLARRRSIRPAEEYRSATSTEWEEFEEHFDRRKVELGNCARPYGTPCQHEHACLRCPMLQINPKMLPRLKELEEDLEDRRKQAEAEGWLGEIEGIDLTLQFLREKRGQALRSEQPGRSVDLGIPSVPSQP